jgi:hypothetical protein
MFRQTLRWRFNMSTKLIKRKQIVVSPENYEALMFFGKVNSSFNDAVTEVLRVAQVQGAKRR